MFLEKTLEQIIYENANTEEGRALLVERGFCNLDGFTFRQVELGGYGRADLVNVCLYPSCGKGPFERYFTIIELKRDVIGIEALLQAHRYVAGMKSHVEEIIEEHDFLDYYEIVLVGSSVEDTGDFVFLYNEMENVTIYVFDYKIDGIHFKPIGKHWRRPNENKSESTIEAIEQSCSCFTRKFLG